MRQEFGQPPLQRLGQAVMQVMHRVATRPLMEVVDVLGDHGDVGVVDRAATARCPSLGATSSTK
jgi:hypothetical protein